MNMNRILLIIICITFIIQLIPIGLPVIGYHNWKSTHYLMQIRDFAENQNIPPHIYFDKTNNYSGVAADTLPIYQIITGSLFIIFGDSIALARFVDILFHLFNIMILFYLIFEITKNKNLSLLSSAAYALFPISIYFSQNIMVLSTSMFFSLLGCFCYHKFRNSHKLIFLISFPLLIAFGFLSYYSFFIVPMIMVAPFILADLKNFEKFICSIKESVCLIFSCTLSLLITALWYLFISGLNKTHEMVVSFQTFFSVNFFAVTYLYFLENLSFLGFIFIPIRVYLAARKYYKNTTFLFVAAMCIGWVMVMSHKLSIHSYHWYPLLPLFSITCALGILYILNSPNLNKFKKNILTVAIFSIFVISSIPLFSVTFQGNDIAGKYITDHGGGNVFHSAHQSYSILCYSGGNGVKLPDNISEMVYLESMLDFRWVYLYEWKFGEVNQSVSNHINESYELVLNGSDYKLFEKQDKALFIECESYSFGE